MPCLFLQQLRGCCWTGGTHGSTGVTSQVLHNKGRSGLKKLKKKYTQALRKAGGPKGGSWSLAHKTIPLLWQKPYDHCTHLDTFGIFRAVLPAHTEVGIQHGTSPSNLWSITPWGSPEVRVG